MGIMKKIHSCTLHILTNPFMDPQMPEHTFKSFQTPKTNKRDVMTKMMLLYQRVGTNTNLSNIIYSDCRKEEVVTKIIQFRPQFYNVIAEYKLGLLGMVAIA